jgi:eukaryotic-like serine/threonine-protein kinase
MRRPAPSDPPAHAAGTSTALPVGGFALEAQIGGGGHGLVWRGRHETSGLEVALKVLPPTADRFALHGLKNEVQAIARLHHPHVVAILDTGLIDARAAQAARALGRPLEEGSPWVAYELASGGDLAQLTPPLPWPALTDVLRTLLSALAHAHARGVVHRDLKPANVLLCIGDDARPGLKLTDFGLAQWEKGARLSGGTPLYMAPEQFDVDGRDVGAWTDLYALGCLATLLASGKPVFEASGWRVLEKLHREATPEPLALGADVPAGFRAWVARLLQKDPAQRFRCAADADAALHALDPSRAAPPTDGLPDTLAEWTRDRSDLKRSLEDAVTLKREGSLAPDAKTEALPPRFRAPRKAPQPTATTRPISVGAVSPPTSWRTGAQLAMPDLRLVEAGLSLWGMRPVPLVGRHDERDALWSALLDVHHAQAARLVCLRGPSGVGKSRLVEWVGHRASELGAARVLRASFSESPARTDGLGGMIARLTQIVGLEEVEALVRADTWLHRWLPGDELSAVELCALAGIVDGAFSSSADRHGALIRFLSALARERPLLVWLDDVHWGAEPLAMLERVLDDAPELRALFVCTAVDELLTRERQARLAVLDDHAAAQTLPIGPLDDEAHDELCHLLLGGASSDLADDLRRRTEGNPMFAVHLVGDWVQRGVLVVAPTGLVLREGASAALPDELFRLWEQRLAATLATLPQSAARALEVAAVLGSAVDLIEWESATELPRDELDALVDALVASGLARRTESGFSFVHVLLRSSVERQAEAAQRLPAAHRAVAKALALLWGTETPVAGARIGRHLLAAGDVEHAAGHLLRAARTAVDEGDVLEAGAVLLDWDRARRALGVKDTDARAGAGLMLRARVASAEGRHDDARALARTVQVSAPDARTLVQAACIEGRACVLSGHVDDGVACFQRARTLAEVQQDEVGLGTALLGLGEAEFYRGNRAASAVHYRAASAIMREAGRKHDVAQLLWALGYVELEEGRLDAARHIFEEQRTLCRAIRDRLGEANAENALGELARQSGAYGEAETHYRAALRIATKSGLSRRWMFRLNLAHTRLAAGDIEGAAQLAAEVLDSPLARVDPIVAVGCWWIVANGAAQRADLPAFDRAAEAAYAIGARGLVEDDLAAVAQRAGDAVAVHDRDRAERAWQFARAVWRTLGRDGAPGS